MCKRIHLTERHRHSGKDCELYFVPRVEPSSISPTTFTKRDLYRDLFISAIYVGLVKMKRYKECTY